MAVLIDSSVWIDHFRTADDRLVGLVSSGKARLHPLIVMEIALGSLRDRPRFLTFLSTLRMVTAIADPAVTAFIDKAALFGTGIGAVDAHLLASCAAQEARLWTRDKRLEAQAERLGLAFSG